MVTSNARAKVKLFTFMSVLVTFFVLLTWFLISPPHVTWQSRLWLGDRTLWAIKNVTRVETFRVSPPLHQLSEKTNLNGKRTVAKCAVISEGKSLGRDSAKQLSSALLAAISSDFKQTHTSFQPGVAFRLWHNDEAVDVAVCFQCSNMNVAEYSQTGTTSRSFSYLRSIDSIHPVLVKLAKKAFPNDRQIQQIKESTN